MNTMNLKPAPINDENKDKEIYCTKEETEHRLSFCNYSCPEFFIDTDQHSKCKMCSCNISMVTIFKFKICPLGNWQ
ncbi:hypothetical protein EB118_22165 [bacterium]|nr:hypothetical protein [bacterium]NDD84659.1 hypothetical protein [bacterium]NDG32762.1 hypothetical protein [bacterium]